MIRPDNDDDFYNDDNAVLVKQAPLIQSKMMRNYTAPAISWMYSFLAFDSHHHIQILLDKVSFLKQTNDILSMQCK